MGEKKVTGRGGRRNYCKGKGGEAKRKSIPVTPVSPMLVGLPVRVNKIKYPRWLKNKLTIIDLNGFFFLELGCLR